MLRTFFAVLAALAIPVCGTAYEIREATVQQLLQLEPKEQRKVAFEAVRVADRKQVYVLNRHVELAERSARGFYRATSATHPLLPIGMGVLALSAVFVLPGAAIMRGAETMTCPMGWDGLSCSLSLGLAQATGTGMIVLGGIAGTAGLIMTIVGAARRYGEVKPQRIGVVYLH